VIAGDDELVLFRVTGRPVHEAFGLYRGETAPVLRSGFLRELDGGQDTVMVGAGHPDGPGHRHRGGPGYQHMIQAHDRERPLCRCRMRRSAAGSAAPPLAFTVNKRSLSVAAADPIPRDGPGAAWKRARLSAGSCHITSSAAGIASRAASHHAAYAAMITAAIAGTTASGARAASSGPGLGGYPPASRASRAGNAKIMRIKAVSQVTPCLFSPTCRLWMT